DPCAISSSAQRRPARLTLFPYTTLFRSDRDAVRRRDDRLRPLALVRALARRARRLRLRRHDQRQHPLDDSGLRDAERAPRTGQRSEEHTSELQSLAYLVCRLLLEKEKLR